MSDLKTKATRTKNIKAKVKYGAQMDDIRKSDKFRRSKKLRSQYKSTHQKTRERTRGTQKKILLR